MLSNSSASVATEMSSGCARADICHAILTASRINGWMTAKVVSGGRKILGFRFKARITSCNKMYMYIKIIVIKVTGPSIKKHCLTYEGMVKSVQPDQLPI